MLTQTELEKLMDYCVEHLIAIELTKTKAARLFCKCPRLNNPELLILRGKLEEAGKVQNIVELEADLRAMSKILTNERRDLTDAFTVAFGNRLRLLDAYHRLNALLNSGYEKEINAVEESLKLLNEVGYPADNLDRTILSDTIAQITVNCDTVNAGQKSIAEAIKGDLSLSDPALLDRIIMGGGVHLKDLQEPELLEIRRSKLNEVMSLVL